MENSNNNTTDEEFRLYNLAQPIRLKAVIKNEIYNAIISILNSIYAVCEGIRETNCINTNARKKIDDRLGCVL